MTQTTIHPVDIEAEAPFHTCTVDDPWRFDGDRCYHPGAVTKHVTIDITLFACPYCGATWRKDDRDE